VVQSLVFEVGVPVAGCDSVLVEESKVQHGWPTVVDWVRSECVGGVCKSKVGCIVDVYQVSGPLGWLVARLPSGVVLVYVTCN